jgi:hypothetical protein
VGSLRHYGNGHSRGALNSAIKKGTFFGCKAKESAHFPPFVFFAFNTGRATRRATPKTGPGSPRPMCPLISGPGKATQQLPSCPSFFSILYSHTAPKRREPAARPHFLFFLGGAFTIGRATQRSTGFTIGQAAQRPPPPNCGYQRWDWYYGRLASQQRCVWRVPGYPMLGLGLTYVRPMSAPPPPKWRSTPAAPYR